MAMKLLSKCKIQRLDSIFDEPGKVCVVVHPHPDGDALGSGIALRNYLMEFRGQGKEVSLISPDRFPESLDFLAGNAGIIIAGDQMDAAVEAIGSSSLIVCLDLNSIGRAGCLHDALSSSKAFKVLVDHHPGPAVSEFDLVFSDTGVSSTCELLFYILVRLSGRGGASRLPVSVSAPLMTGMTTDTNNFANSVFPSTLRMASSLLASGVDRDDILSHLYNDYRENRLRAMGFFLEQLMHITADGVAYVVMDKETIGRFDLREGETEGFVNLPLGISTVKISVFLREDEGYYRVSVRSKKGWSANTLAARYFNGGGHECAAGGKLFFPKDIPSREMAADYIEKVTARFMQI